MKISLILLVVLFGVNISFAQTNTFPPDGSSGIGTLFPTSYFHGGTNKVLEIFNSSTLLNSQSHIVLSTGATFNNSSAGTVTWMSKNSSGFKGMAYIGSTTQGDASVNSSANLVFATSNGGAVHARMVIDKDGNIEIGKETQTMTMSIKGKIRSQEIKVETANWPDYVFGKDYELPSLQEIEQHIKEKGHLPGIPSAVEVKANGVDLGEMNAKLLKKIEELTLYLIESEKRNTLQNAKQQNLIDQQQKDIKYLKSKLK